MPNLETTKEVFPDTAWHEVGSGGSEPAFANSWVNYDSTTWQTAGFRIDGEGWVHLKGLIKSGTGNTTAFTLPVGYRPLKYCSFPVLANGSPAFVNIQSDGVVTAFIESGSNVYYSLDGIQFPAITSSLQLKNYHYPLMDQFRYGSTDYDRYVPGYFLRDTGFCVFSGGIFGPAGANATIGLAPHVPRHSYVFGTNAVGANHRLDMRNGRLMNSQGTTFGTYVMPGGREWSLEYIEEGWTPPSLVNSWISFQNSDHWAGAGYYKDIHGFVHMRGLLASGSAANATMFTLPAGYRPAKNALFLQYSNAGNCRIDVQSNGVVYAQAGGSTGYTSISGLLWYADQ